MPTLTACVLLAGLGSITFAPTGSYGDVDKPTVAAVVPRYREPVTERRLKTNAIETIRLGMRTLGTNPDRSQVPAGLDEPNAATWRTVVLAIEKEDGGTLAIELLRPVAWLLAQEAAAGSTIWLEIEEMAVRGPALVLEVGPCPEIEDGPGNVVTGRFVHSAAKGGALLDIAFEGAEGVKGVTPNHPFWSVDRQEFVRAEELVEGEQVDTAHGRAAVAHVAWRRAGPETRLYNLETHAEHVYRVGRDGVLVHNAGKQYIGGDAYLALSPDDAAALAAGRRILPKGTSGSILDHIQGRPTKYISVSLQENGTARFVGADGVAVIDLKVAVATGSGLVPHKQVLQIARRHGRTQDVNNVVSAQEVLLTNGLDARAVIRVLANGK